ncbi:MAG: ATP-binding protein [Clostridia bacterium]|nr:ATP-binding protein [Clostridia bacterium]
MNSLVNLKIKNFRSFYEETIFSMQAISNKEFAELNTFKCDEKIFPKYENELLKTAVIFGANASGKTNLVKSLDFMRALVLTSSNPLNPVVQQNTPFAFFDGSDKESTLFEIELVAKDIFYDYGFEITNNQFTNEFLRKRTNGRLVDIFNRNIIGVDLNTSKKKKNSIGNINSQSLFLSFANTPFLALDEETILDLRNVLEWFSEPNLIIVNDEVMNKYKIYQEDDGKYAKLALDFIKQADIGVENFSVVQEKIADKTDPYIRVKGKHPPQFMPLDKEVLGLDLKTEFNVFNKEHNIVGKKEVYLERDFGFHSDGTYRLLSILGLILKVLDRGGVLVIDEIDSKLNFLIVDYIFKSFNSINKNINNAQ